jgi:uncharacterized damage-inducible protein DinB
MTAEHFRTLFDYNFWAHRQVWDCVMQLNEAQYRQPCDYSIGSVHEQLAHTLAAERLWLGRARQDTAPVFPSSEEFPDRAALRAAWDALEGEWRTFVAGLNDTDLDTTITYRTLSSGATLQTPLWLILSHILNHGTDHRAQTLALIHQVGGKTVAQDLMLYSQP